MHTTNADGMTRMRSNAIVLIIALGAALVLAAGCGGGGGDGGSNSYLPLTLGSTWTYTLTLGPGLVPAQIPGGTDFPYTETVVGIADLQGTEYASVLSVRGAVDPWPERSWQQFRRESAQSIYARVPLVDRETGEVISSYDLPILMLPPAAGLSWSDPQDSQVVFAVAATADRVTVPAGTFTCVRVDRDEDTIPDGDEEPVHYTVRSWYARGVGLVRDETLEDDTVTSTLVLQSYTVE